MKTFLEELETAKNEWAIKRNWDKQPIYFVWDYYTQWKKEHPTETAYLNTIQDYILSKENIPSELHDYLHTEIYICSQKWSKDEKEQYKNMMLSAGWLELKDTTEFRGKILLNAKHTSDWCTHNIDKQAKLITSGDNKLFVIPQGKRTRGWYASSLENAFYKPL